MLVFEFQVRLSFDADRYLITTIVQLSKRTPPMANIDIYLQRTIMFTIDIQKNILVEDMHVNLLEGFIL